MPWKETCVEEQRMRFMAAYLEEGSNWSMTELCEAFGVSRKSGYKWVERYGEAGLEGLRDRSRSPRMHPNATAPELVSRLIAARQKHPFWGPRKLLVGLRRDEPELEWPATSTAAEILKRAGMVQGRRRHRDAVPLQRSELSTPTYANQVWGVDYKGWFRTRDGQRCDPLTISDLFSRYLLECRRVKRPDTQCARRVFERVFREHGLPDAIRSDNGGPFASQGLGGLSQLSVWWIKLGIALERIQPGRPDQNGCHERMHRTLKRETALPPSINVAAQQRSFDRFRRTFNMERPHEALNDTPPAQWYQQSTRPYPSREPEVEYPANFEVRRVRTSGEIKWGGALLYVSQALVGEPVGLEEVSDGHWKMYFGAMELALFDIRTRKLVGYTPRVRRGTAPDPTREASAILENSGRPTGSLRSPKSSGSGPA